MDSCLPSLSSVNAPAVSIVIPTLNRLDLTRACLKALRDHTPAAEFEIVVVDNASTDDTRDFLAGEQRAGRLSAILNEKNLGFARACNQGAAAARGQYVLFLNNDTEVRSGWLAPLIQTAEADPRIGAVGSKLLFADNTIQHAGVVLLDDRAHGDPLLAHHIFSRQPQDLPEANRPRICPALTAACLFVRREIFDRVGCFDEEFWNGYEDVDLCFKISAAGKLLVYQPASVVTHHESQSGPERFRQARQNIARLHKKWLGRVRPDFVVQENGRITPTGAGRLADYLPAKSAQEKNPRAVSIVILAINQLEHTRKCMASLFAHTRAPFEVIFVDNASTDGTAEFLASLRARHPNFKVITNRKNLGFAAGNNQGLAVAKGEILVLLNNDTIVTPGWIEGMTAVLDADASAGLVGPVSNRVSGPQQIQTNYADDGARLEFATNWREQNAGQTQTVTRLVGFCLLFKRAVLDAIGGLDERFGSGNFEDDDFCLRAKFAGFGSRIARDVFIHHVGSQTFRGAKVDYRQAMLRNWNLFRTKWNLPADVSLERGYPVPAAKPESVALKVALPSLNLTHKIAGETHWLEEAPAATPVKMGIPTVARLGNLDEARKVFGAEAFEPAWKLALAATGGRPFHPEGFLLLAEIALAAGDGKSAKLCALQARDLAPDWKPAKQFLSKPLKGNAKLEWLDPSSILQSPSSPRLSVCLIVKNEEQFLEQCLKSIQGLAQQIVVVDTGSTDRTMEIAKAHGAEVHSFAWCDDFSAARNAALEHATGDWVLMLDADEELPAAEHTRLRADMRRADVIAMRLPLVNKGEEGQGKHCVPRLFRNAPGAYYYSRIHEQVFPSLIQFGRAFGMKTAIGAAELLHHGYSKELIQNRNKVERNLKLLRQAVVEFPNDANLQMNLGLELVHSDDLPAGLAHYREAFRLMSGQPPADVAPELREVLLTQFTCHLYKVRAHDEIVQALNSPLAKQRALTASLHFALGLALFELKRFRDAAEQMRECLAKRKQPALAPINTDIFTAVPHHCLALSLMRAGDTAEAGKAFKAGLPGGGDAPLPERASDEASLPRQALKLDYAKFLAGQNRPVEALQQLNELVAENCRNAAAWQLGGEIALGKPEYLEFALDWTGEAFKALPDNPAVAMQRAEALMLNGHATEASGLWRNVWLSEPQPRLLAAWILCEVAGSRVPHSPSAGEDERTASREFIQWYQKLIVARAESVVEKINGQLDRLKHALPSAAKMLENALMEAAPACTGTFAPQSSTVKRTKILVVSNAADCSRTYGSGLILWDFLEWFARAGTEVHFISARKFHARHHVKRLPIARPPALVIEQLPSFVRKDGVWESCLPDACPGNPVNGCGVDFKNHQIMSEVDAAEMAAFAEAAGYDAVIADFIWCAPVLAAIKSPGIRRGIIAHDIMESRVKSLLGSGATSDVDPEVALKEKQLLGFADFVCVETKDDQAFIERHLPHVETFLMPRALLVQPGNGGSVEKSILFVGGISPHNVQGIEWFLNNVWPDVLAKCPEAKLRVVGSVAHNIGGTHPNVGLVGMVGDLLPAYQTAAVCIVPLLSGSGFKTKLIEALGFGKACVSTSVGAAGLPRSNPPLIVADAADKFASAVNSLLKDPGLRREFESRAADYVRKCHDPEVVYSPILNYFDSHAEKTGESLLACPAAAK